MTIYIFVALIFVSVVGIIWSIAVLLTGRRDLVAERLEQMRTAPARPKEVEGLLLLTKLANFVAGIFPPPEKLLSRYHTLLAHAGFKREGALLFFYGIKLILTVALPVIFFFTAFRFFEFKMGVAVTVLFAFLGFFVVDGYLSYKVRNRQEKIFHELPDVLDLLAIVVEAGLGLDAALTRVSEEQVFTKTFLAVELKQVSREIMVGLPRADALRNLYERTGVEDIKAFTAMMIQTERFGTSISQSLKVFSDSLRTRRRQMAEEAAAKTTIKLVFPLVFFIFPAIFVVLLAPAAINIYKTAF